MDYTLSYMASFIQSHIICVKRIDLMSDLIRLDKYLADMSVGTRSRVKSMIGKGKIKVNGNIIKDASIKINKSEDKIEVFDNTIEYKAFEYYMLNKPAGVITATEDNRQKTVLELITDRKRKDLFPVGRLDRDTEGLLLITNDGELAHNLLSPKKHVDKTYYVETDRSVSENEVKLIQNGVDIGEEKLTLPAILRVCDNVSTDKNAYELTICEGKFHQVKRMFQAVGAKVTYLKRLRMGTLVLDEKLKSGEYRALKPEEIEALYNISNGS